jgi:hypothetical protein
MKNRLKTFALSTLLAILVSGSVSGVFIYQRYRAANAELQQMANAVPALVTWEQFCVSSAAGYGLTKSAKELDEIAATLVSGGCREDIVRAAFFVPKQKS